MDKGTLSPIYNDQVQWKSRLFALLALCETGLFGGISFGWGTLVYLLKEEGIYSDLCLPLDNSALQNNVTIGTKVLFDKSDLMLSRSCTDQDQRFNLWFGISTVVGTTSNVIIGKIIQLIGASKTRIIFMPVFIAGALCLAFTSKVVAALTPSAYTFGASGFTSRMEVNVFNLISQFHSFLTLFCNCFMDMDLPWLVLPGLSMLFVGGFSVQISNFRVSLFLTVGSSLYLGLVSGFFNTSSIMTKVIKAFYDNGISRMYSFIGLAILHLIISGTNTVVHFRYDIPIPDIEIEVDSGITNLGYVAKDELNLNNNNKDDVINEKNGYATDKTKDEKNGYATNETKDKDNYRAEIRTSLGEHLKSSIYCIHVVFTSILVLIFVFFLGSINKRLEVVLKDKRNVEFFTDVLSYALMGGIIGSFISGSILEWQKNVFSDSKQEAYRRLMPQVLPLSICSVLAISLSALACTHSSVMFYGLFVNVALFRSFLYSVNACFCSSIFPPDQVSFLYGFVITVSGFVSSLQYALFVWMNSYDGALLHVNILLLALSITTVVHILNIYRQARRKVVNEFHDIY